MDIKVKIEQELKTAELYWAQGLYAEARKAYDHAVALIEAHPQIKNRESLLVAMAQKINELQETADHVESAPATQEMAPQVQTLIKNLFTFSAKDDPDAVALEEAITLAKFGQIERAIQELSELLNKDLVRMEAAKNILRCHLLLSAPRKAIDTYHQWLSSSLFSGDELERVRRFLEKLLEKEGETAPLLVTAMAVESAAPETQTPAEPSEDIDIGSVVITLDSGPLQGEPIELDVKLQAGNMVSMIVESEEKTILDNLNVGFRLKNIQFNSSVAIFRGEGVVSAKALIDSGPKQGDYHLDIIIEDS